MGINLAFENKIILFLYTVHVQFPEHENWLYLTILVRDIKQHVFDLDREIQRS